MNHHDDGPQQRRRETRIRNSHMPAPLHKHMHTHAHGAYTFTKKISKKMGKWENEKITKKNLQKMSTKMEKSPSAEKVDRPSIHKGRADRFSPS